MYSIVELRDENKSEAFLFIFNKKNPLNSGAKYFSFFKAR